MTVPLKYNANLWLSHPIHKPSGTACFKRGFRSDLSPEVTLVVSTQKKSSV